MVVMIESLEGELYREVWPDLFIHFSERKNGNLNEWVDATTGNDINQ